MNIGKEYLAYPDKDSIANRDMVLAQASLNLEVLVPVAPSVSHSPNSLPTYGASQPELISNESRVNLEALDITTIRNEVISAQAAIEEAKAA